MLVYSSTTESNRKYTEGSVALVSPTVEALPDVRRHRLASPGRPPQWPGVLESVAELNAAKPGEWVRVAEYATRVSANRSSYRIRKQHDAAGRFQFASRTIDGRGVLYARLRTEGAK